MAKWDTYTYLRVGVATTAIYLFFFSKPSKVEKPFDKNKVQSSKEYKKGAKEVEMLKEAARSDEPLYISLGKKKRTNSTPAAKE